MRGLAVEGIPSIPVFAGAAEALAALKAGGVQLALVSSNAEAAVRAVLGPAAELIDRYACGSSLFGKSQKFEAVLGTLRLSRDETIAIGDEIRDIDAARKTHLTAGSITFGFNSRVALERHHPDYLFDSYDQLVGAVLG
jgi:phosphoglycolate phosphatase